MRKNKSAKDFAFDKERAKYRKEIRILESENHQLSMQIVSMQKEAEKVQEEIRQLKEWNERLLEYMDMTEEEMRNRIEKERIKDELLEHISDINDIMGRFRIL